MRICLACSAEIPDDNWLCPRCGWTPAQSGGVHLFAPQISGATEGFDPAWYAELASLESRSFWFVARNRLIRWLARRHAPRRGKYLELGCGTGFVLEMIREAFPDWRVYATEAQPEGIEFARRRVAGDVTFFQLDACAIPFRSEFDVVGAFDVIEHIRDDERAMGEIYASLKPGGILLISVPQHMFLWSRYDEVGRHFRRYAPDELEAKLRARGFSILASTSFNALLLPLMAASRYLRMNRSVARTDVLDELRMSRGANGILSLVLGLEFRLVRMGLRFSFGGSRMVVAKKAALPEGE
jgi:SAM-dependent methyltransferase